MSWNRFALPFVACSAAFALLATPALATSGGTLMSVPFSATAVNDHLVVVGVVRSPREAQMLKSGVVSVLAPGDWTPAVINNTGVVIGGTLRSFNGASSTAFTPAGGASAFESISITDDGQPIWVQDVVTSTVPALVVRKDVFVGTRVAFTGTWGAEHRYEAVYAAGDGGIVIRGKNEGDTGPSISYYVPPGSNSTIALPTDVTPLGVGRSGWIVGIMPNEGIAVTLKIAPGGGITRTELSRPSATTAFSFDIAKINGRGRLVMPETNEDGDFVALWSHRPESGWSNLTQDVRPASPADAVPELVDVNEWGDILVEHMKPALGGGLDFVGTSGLLFKRAALTGIIADIGSGAGISRATARQVVGRKLLLTGGPETLDATTTAGGHFSLDVAPGSGYRLAAPAGTCIRTASGCHTTLPLDVADTAAVSLTSAKVPGLASFVAARNAALKQTRGKVSIAVKCAADVPCKVSLALLKGRKLLGKGSLRVPAGATRKVRLRLTAAGRRQVAAKAITVVRATLSVKSGSASAKVYQRFRLRR